MSEKDLDDAMGNELEARASVEAARATLEKAKLGLAFTKITSPIDGIAGIAKAQLGNLVGPGSVEELTIVSTVNPIKVYIPMSEQEYMLLAEKRIGINAKSNVDMFLADGIFIH